MTITQEGPSRFITRGKHTCGHTGRFFTATEDYFGKENIGSDVCSACRKELYSREATKPMPKPRYKVTITIVDVVATQPEPIAGYV